MTIEEIRWMTELFRVGKMSRAAENLFVSQPALSQCLQRIEQQLGFKLFERSNKGLTPTVKGLLFYETARRITNAYQQFLYQAEQADRQQMREITIGMAPFLSYCCAVDMLSALQKHFPEMQFQVFEANSAGLLEALQENRIHLAVVHETIQRDDLAGYPFGVSPSGIFLRRGSALRQYAYEQDGQRYLDPAYLAGEPLSFPRKGQASRILMEQVLSEASIQPVVSAELGHITTRYRCALEGIASTISPITGEALSLDRQQSESIIYRIPPRYKNAFSELIIAALPEVARRIPEDVYPIIAESIIDNRSFGVERRRDPADGGA